MCEVTVGIPVELRPSDSGLAPIPPPPITVIATKGLPLESVPFTVQLEGRPVSAIVRCGTTCDSALQTAIGAWQHIMCKAAQAACALGFRTEFSGASTLKTSIVP